MPGFLTVLSSAEGGTQTKRITPQPDGSYLVSPPDPESKWVPSPRHAGSRDELLATLRSVAKHQIVIRGACPATAIGTEVFRRMVESPEGAGIFTDVPRRWVVLDFDDVMVPDAEHAKGHTAVFEWLRSQLPGDLPDVDMVAGYSASQGFKKAYKANGCTSVRARLGWVYKTPVLGRDVKHALAGVQKALALDFSVLRPVQPLFVAPPVLPAGMADPLEGARWFALDGTVGEATAPPPAPPAPERKKATPAQKKSDKALEPLRQRLVAQKTSGPRHPHTLGATMEWLISGGSEDMAEAIVEELMAKQGRDARPGEARDIVRWAVRKIESGEAVGVNFLEAQKMPPLPPEEQAKADENPFDDGEVEARTAARIAEKPAGECLLELARNPPPHRPEVIGGLLREGSVMALAALPKIGKSVLLMGLVRAFARGGEEWLDHAVPQRKVLLLDLEMDHASLGNRAHAAILAPKTKPFPPVQDETLAAADEAPASPPAPEPELCAPVVYAFRGRPPFNLGDADDLAWLVEQIKKHDAKVVILDPLSRAYPEDFDENDNVQVSRLIEGVQRVVTEETGVAFIFAHHVAKGSSDRHAVEMGRGAGALGGAVDSLVAIKHHKLPGHVIFEAAVRDFPTPAAKTLTMARYPFFTVEDGIAPEGRNAQESKARKPAAPSYTSKDELVAGLAACGIDHAKPFKPRDAAEALASSQDGYKRTTCDSLLRAMVGKGWLFEVPSENGRPRYCSAPIGPGVPTDKQTWAEGILESLPDHRVLKYAEVEKRAGELGFTLGRTTFHRARTEVAARRKAAAGGLTNAGSVGGSGA